MKEKKMYWLKEYKEIHELVYIYQLGSQAESKKAACELMERFEIFLNKYFRLLKFGQCDLSHTSLRSFIKLYIADAKERTLVNSYFVNPSAMKIAEDTIYKITTMFQSSTEDDIMNELYTIFFTMCRKYKDTRPSFHHYIKRNFHFYACRHFDKMCKDVVARGNTVSIHTIVSSKDSARPYSGHIEFSELLQDYSVEADMDKLLNEIESHFNIELSKLPVLKTKKVSAYDNLFLNVNWINGITCSNLFKVLTPFERKILVMWYVECKTDTDIANIFGVCRGTINRRRNVSKNKFQNELDLNGNLDNLRISDYDI